MKKILLLLCAYACSIAAEGNSAASNVISFNTTLLDSMGKFFFTYPTALPDSNALRELQKNFIIQRFEKFPFSAKDIAASLSLYKEQNKEIEILKDQVSLPLPGIVQFVTYHYSYSPGNAHGEGGSKVGLYTLADGKKIELKSIFTKGSEKSIIQLIIKEFLKMQNLQRLEDYSYTKKESDFTPVNAMISDLGIDFIYPTYKLAPHSAGEQKIFLPWDTLRLYLNKQSAIYQKLNF